MSTGTRACSGAEGAYEYEYAVCVSLPAFRLFLIEPFRSGKIHREQRVGRVAIIGALWGELQFVTVGRRIHATIPVLSESGGEVGEEQRIAADAFARFPLWH
jgi:hypothetical protein